MIQLPDRISKLIQRIEAGETVTQHDLDRIASLQALDIAKAGEDFAREQCATERELSNQYREMMESAT